MTDQKPGDSFIVDDADWTKAVFEVGKKLHNWKMDTIPLISPSASCNRMRQLSSILKINAVAQKLREGGKK